MAMNLFQSFMRRFRARPYTRPRAVPSNKSGSGRSFLTIESLEGRVVPAAPLVSYVMSGTASTTITGTVYEDLDQNGIRSGGENGVSGWTVFLDLDNSGTLNRDAAGDLEPSALTNKDGDYVLGHLMPGTYRVAEIVQPGWEPTAPAFQDITAIKDKDTKANFFNFSGGSIIGTVWNDLNHDGVRATDPSTGAFTEPGLSGWGVFLDLNNNKTPDLAEPITTTDAEGRYAFNNLPPGDYEVTEVKPGSWEVPKGFDIKQTASVVARQEFVQDFANYSLTNGSIKGTIWNDLNVDGVRQTDPVTGAFTEPGLADWTVFLDTNNNGSIDIGELTAITNTKGEYSFISLASGDYEVTEVLPTGWNLAPTFDSRQTVAVTAGEQSTAGDFANFTVLNGSVQGTVWNDLNRNGSRDVNLAGAFTDPGLANWTVYLDLNRNGVADPAEPTALTDANGNYTIPDLQVGDYEVREILPTGWEPTITFSDSYAVAVFSGAATVAHDFANFNITTAVAGSVSGTVWNDLNGNGIRDKDPVTGAFTDPGQSGWTVFVDLNSNGILDGTEPKSTSAADGSYTISGVLPGSISVIEQASPGWRSTSPISSIHSLALKNAENVSGLDFGNEALKNSTISGRVFADSNKDGLFSVAEKGLANIVVYLDYNNNSILDSGEPQTLTSPDQYFTPALDEAGVYSFTHLAAGNYTVRAVFSAALSATPVNQLFHAVSLVGAQGIPNVDFAAQYRANEIHGVKFDDLNGNHQRDAGEPVLAGDKIFIDLNRDNILDAGEPTAVTQSDGSYSFTNLAPGAYVVRESIGSGRNISYPTTTGGTLWPQGVSNPAVGIVTPGIITASLGLGQVHRETVSITLPNTGALTNLVDVFLLFDDTGSFVNNSPIVRSAFPTIISQLQASLPGTDLGFGVGRFEEYGNFASEYATGRPFILNQPIVAASTAGYMTSIQAALNRTTPGYGGDQPETDIEALYQLVTGLGFDGNNNGSVLDSGAAGLVSTQLNPGSSGDVPSFASFTADASGSVLAGAGKVGGGGFRTGALPIILVATDTGFAYQPKGETNITGVGGVSLPVSSLTQTSRPTTPFGSGAGIQETVTGLNALGALVIGLGTNTQTNVDPRQGLESLSKLTGAVNRSTASINNGTGTPIAPGDPLYFQIASGFAGSVTNGVVNAIQNAVSNVAVDVTVQASDPRVKIINHTGVRAGIGSGQTGSFDIEFVGDGVPHRFDIQFVRNGTNVILGSIPVVLGTPISGDGYDFEELSEGEIHSQVDFGTHTGVTTVTTPTLSVIGGSFLFDGTAHAATATAKGSDGSAIAGTFTFTYNGSSIAPTDAGVYTVISTFTSSDPNYSNATGTATLTINAATPAISVTGGLFVYDANLHAAVATATGIGGVSVSGNFAFTYNGLPSTPTDAGTYSVIATFTSNDPNYSSGTGTATLTISATEPTITVTGGNFAFDGAPHAASATTSGVSWLPVDGTFSITYNGSAAIPTASGVYAVIATFTSSDSNYTSVSGAATLSIGMAPPTITVNGGTFTFDGSAHTATATVAGVGGAPVSGSLSFTYNGSATVPVNAGTYAVFASFTSSDSNYTFGSGVGTVIINKATPSFSNLSSPIILVGTGNTPISGHIAAGTVIPVGETVNVTLNGISQSATIDALGNFSVGFPTGPLVAGTYPVTFGFAGNTNKFNAATAGSSVLTVTAPTQSIDAKGITISGTAGAPLTKAVATIANTLRASTSYSATIFWGDGGSSTGVISGTGATLSVIGSHTYASSGTLTIHVTIHDTLGLGLSGSTASNATIANLGQKAGKTREAEFWQESQGQTLLRNFNGGSSHSELGNWLAAYFPNLYGAEAGPSNLSSKSNAYIADFFKAQWRVGGDGVATQVLATALNVYATTSSLGGAQGGIYGFVVSSTGLGARNFDIGSAGAAVGVANNTKMNVFEMLRSVDKLAKNGIFYSGDRTLQSLAKGLFSKLNSI